MLISGPEKCSMTFFHSKHYFKTVKINTIFKLNNSKLKKILLL